MDGPGIYDGFGGSTCVFEPGLYVFTGDVRLSGHGQLNAPGSTLYFTCGEGTTAPSPATRVAKTVPPFSPLVREVLT